MEFYKLKNKEAPWGDYGNILLSGMTAHLGRQNGFLQLERTAPYVPPLINSGIGNIIITDKIKAKLQLSGLSGISFRPVIKKHIVYVDWTSWDLNAEEPLFYPDSGEPEDYILHGQHSETLAHQLEDLWELVVQTCGTLDENDHLIDCDNNLDIFMADNRGYIFVTAKGKDWIEKNAGEWVAFEKM